MNQIERLFLAAKKKYNSNADACDEIRDVAIACIRRINTEEQERWAGPSGKAYTIFKAETSRSRPFLTAHLTTEAAFLRAWNELLASADRDAKVFTLPEAVVTHTIYNTVMPFCVCFDIWKPKSRKSPGTFFEIVLGTLIARVLPTTVQRTKHIQLPTEVRQSIVKAANLDTPTALVDAPDEELVLTGEAEEALKDTEDASEDDGEADMSQVATDIVFEFEGYGIVIPAKTTTRERIVQPFAHQRILDGVFGEGRYISLLACVSETQRSDIGHRVNEICVPGTITLFQRHLARLAGC